jgi:hypothetical protein
MSVRNYDTSYQQIILVLQRNLFSTGGHLYRLRTIGALEWVLWGLHVSIYPSQKKKKSVELNDFISTFCLLFVDSKLDQNKIARVRNGSGWCLVLMMLNLWVLCVQKIG